MDAKELFLLLVGCILSSNYVLVHFFGTESLLENNKESIKGNLLFSLYLLVVLLLSSLLLWPLEKFVLANLGYLRLVVYTLAILLVVALVSVVMKKKFSSFVTLALSSAVLGSLLFFNNASYSVLQNIFASVGVAIGYLLTSLALSAVSEKIRDKNIPSPFRGAPILLVALSIISLTVFAF